MIKDEGRLRDFSPAGYFQGYCDFFCDLGFFDNPYPEGSDNSRHWVDGYVRAIEDERDFHEQHR